MCRALSKPVGSSGVQILPYHPSERWSRGAMGAVQQFTIQPRYVVGEMLRLMHSYHLDEVPMLWSATAVFHRIPTKLPLLSGGDLAYIRLRRKPPDPRGVSLVESPSTAP